MDIVRRRWLSMLAGLMLLGLVNNRICWAQTQCFKVCQEQFDSTQPESPERLRVSLRMTDALFQYDLEMAFRQSQKAHDLAIYLNDLPAQSICLMDQALNIGLMKGSEEATPCYDQAMTMFDYGASPD